MRQIKMARRAPVWLDAQAPLAEWYATRLGQSILDELERTLAGRLGDVFGYQGLQIGNPAPERELLAGAGLQRRLKLDAPACLFTGDDDARPRADFAADVTALPVAADSVKAVLFFHTLDFCDHPHQALREADRVLVDDGQLLIVGFNPLSAFGLRRALRALAGLGGRPPWNGQFWSRGRIAEWLSVLDYRVLASQPLFLRPPLQSERLLRRLHGLERARPLVNLFGGLYVIQARKQTVPMTLLRRQAWRGARVGAGVRHAGYASAARPTSAGVVRLDSVRPER